MIVSIKDIKANKTNPRNIAPEKLKKLKKSISDFPDMLNKRPLVCFTDKDGKYVVLGGNMRLKACKELGIKELPIILADEWTEEQKDEFIIKDNVGFGEWDWGVLQTDWDLQSLADWGLEGFPFDDATELEAEEDDYEQPDDMQVDVVLGDLIEIGKHRLLCGDSTKESDVNKLMNGQKADMVFTDPPYALFGNSTGVAGITDDNMVRPFFKSIMNMLKKNTISYGHIYMCCDWHSAFAIEACARDVELKAKNMCIWDKGDGGVGAMYQQCYEIVWFFDNSPTNKTTMNTVKAGVKTVNGVPNIWRFPRVTSNREHNAQKPVEMISVPIENGSDKGNLVLDLFLGSGSTMVAAHQLNRKCYGMELDPKYCQVIIDRMLNLDPNLEIKINGNEYKK